MRRLWLNNIPYVTRSQRVGILLLIVLIAVLQGAYFVYCNWTYQQRDHAAFDEEWMAQQLVLDSLSQERSKREIQPFNPNFISDYKGFTLGMTESQIDRLHAFREKNLYVNSALEFQRVTSVSDRWLDSVGKYFQFPEWKSKTKGLIANKKSAPQTTKLQIKDINEATAADLMEVRGIGEVYSERIIKDRALLGGFIHIDQLDFIRGLSDEALANLKLHFEVLNKPEVVKTNVNTADIAELIKIPYINYQLARAIVIYRSSHGDLKNSNELENIVNFPLDKLQIISLYLAF